MSTQTPEAPPTPVALALSPIAVAAQRRPTALTRTARA